MRSLLVLPAFLVFAGVASADESKSPPKEDKLVVRDQLGLFSQPAIDEATRIAGQVRERYRIDLFIDTTTEMPAETEFEKKAWFKWQAQSPARDNWAMDRADELGQEGGTKINGIYVVIIDGGPGKRDVRVVPWPAGRGADISPEKRRQLRKILLTLDGEKDQAKRDRILQRTVELFRAQARTIRDPEPSPISAAQAYIVCACFVGAWLVTLFVRWRVNANVRPGDPEPVEIYQPAMMGTLFGVPAAFWVNDELFRVIPPEVPPVSTTPSDNFSLPAMPTLPSQAEENPDPPPSL